MEEVNWSARIIGAPGFEDFDANVVLISREYGKAVVRTEEGDLFVVPLSSVHILF